jgi:hypothetical protein
VPLSSGAAALADRPQFALNPVAASTARSLYVRSFLSQGRPPPRPGSTDRGAGHVRTLPDLERRRLFGRAVDKVVDRIPGPSPDRQMSVVAAMTGLISPTSLANWSSVAAAARRARPTAARGRFRAAVGRAVYWLRVKVEPAPADWNASVARPAIEMPVRTTGPSESDRERVLELQLPALRS